MCKWSNGGIPVDLPDGIATDRGKRTVCIDECIIEPIKALWAAGIQTRGCCCGHDKRDPDVILEASCDPTQLMEAYRILRTTDKRRWSILQWKLVEVAVVSNGGELEASEVSQVSENNSCKQYSLSNKNFARQHLTEDMKLIYEGRTYLIIESAKSWDELSKHFRRVGVVVALHHLEKREGTEIQK